MANVVSRDNNGDEKKDEEKRKFGSSSGDHKGKGKKMESPDLNLPAPTTPDQPFSSAEKGKSALESHSGSSFQSDPNPNPNPNLESDGSPPLMKRRIESDKETDDQDESDGYGLHSGSMMLTVCPGCFQYLLIPKEEPQCPKCAAHVPVPGKKKPKIDLNSTSG